MRVNTLRSMILIGALVGLASWMMNARREKPVNQARRLLRRGGKMIEQMDLGSMTKMGRRILRAVK